MNLGFIVQPNILKFQGDKKSKLKGTGKPEHELVISNQPHNQFITLSIFHSKSSILDQRILSNVILPKSKVQPFKKSHKLKSPITDSKTVDIHGMEDISEFH